MAYDPRLEQIFDALFVTRFNNRLTLALPLYVHQFYLQQIAPTHLWVNLVAAETFWGTWERFAQKRGGQIGWYGFVHQLWLLLGMESNAPHPRYAPYLINDMRERLLGTFFFQPHWLPQIHAKLNPLSTFLQTKFAPIIAAHYPNFHISINGSLPRLLFEYYLAYEQIQINQYIGNRTPNAQRYYPKLYRAYQRMMSCPIEVNVHIDGIICADTQKFVNLYSQTNEAVRKQWIEFAYQTIDNNVLSSGQESISIRTGIYNFTIIPNYLRKLSLGNMQFSLALDQTYYKPINLALPEWETIPRDTHITGIFKSQTTTSTLWKHYQHIAQSHNEYFSKDEIISLANCLYTIKECLTDGWILSIFDFNALRWCFNDNQPRTYENTASAPLMKILTNMMLEKYYARSTQTEKNNVIAWVERLRASLHVVQTHAAVASSSASSSASSNIAMPLPRYAALRAQPPVTSSLSVIPMPVINAQSSAPHSEAAPVQNASNMEPEISNTLPVVENVNHVNTDSVVVPTEEKIADPIVPAQTEKITEKADASYVSVELQEEIMAEKPDDSHASTESLPINDDNGNTVKEMPFYLYIEDSDLHHTLDSNHEDHTQTEDLSHSLDNPDHNHFPNDLINKKSDTEQPLQLQKSDTLETKDEDKSTAASSNSSDGNRKNVKKRRLKKRKVSERNTDDSSSSDEETEIQKTEPEIITHKNDTSNAAVLTPNPIGRMRQQLVQSWYPTMAPGILALLSWGTSSALEDEAQSDYVNTIAIFSTATMVLTASMSYLLRQQNKDWLKENKKKLNASLISWDSFEKNIALKAKHHPQKPVPPQELAEISATLHNLLLSGYYVFASQGIANMPESLYQIMGKDKKMIKFPGLYTLLGSLLGYYLNKETLALRAVSCLPGIIFGSEVTVSYKALSTILSSFHNDNFEKNNQLLLYSLNLKVTSNVISTLLKTGERNGLEKNIARWFILAEEWSQAHRETKTQRLRTIVHQWEPTLEQYELFDFIDLAVSCFPQKFSIREQFYQRQARAIVEKHLAPSLKTQVTFTFWKTDTIDSMAFRNQIQVLEVHFQQMLITNPRTQVCQIDQALREDYIHAISLGCRHYQQYVREDKTTWIKLFSTRRSSSIAWDGLRYMIEQLVKTNNQAIIDAYLHYMKTGDFFTKNLESAAYFFFDHPSCIKFEKYFSQIAYQTQRTNMLPELFIQDTIVICKKILKIQQEGYVIIKEGLKFRCGDNVYGFNSVLNLLHECFALEVEIPTQHENASADAIAENTLRHRERYLEEALTSFKYNPKTHTFEDGREKVKILSLRS